MTYGINLGVITVAEKTHLFCNRTLSELSLAQNLEIQVDIC